MPCDVMGFAVGGDCYGRFREGGSDRPQGRLISDFKNSWFYEGLQAILHYRKLFFSYELLAIC